MRRQAHWDGWGQVLSLLCVAHCLLLPLVLGLMPALVAETLEELPFHQGLVALAGVVGTASFVPGFRHHRDGRVVALGATGLGLLLLAQAVPPEGMAETGATLAGGLLLLVSHGLNRRRCRDACTPAAQQLGEETPLFSARPPPAERGAGSL